MRPWIVALLAFALTPRASAESPWSLQTGGTTERLRGVAAVDDRVAWACGNRGTCLRTTDGGATWERRVVPNSDDLDFRDVAAFDARHAYLLSIGPGAASRITRTHDGGLHWNEVFRNKDPRGFLDAIAFWDVDHGLALSDPVDGRFKILKTNDGGKVWEETSDPGTMPAALPDEGAFAASGTCLVVGPGDNAWFVTGGAARARAFRSVDRGLSWTVADLPLRAGGASRGAFSVAFGDARNGVAVGGDYKAIGDPTAVYAFTTDGGATWTPSPGRDRPDGPSGFRSAVAWLPDRPRPTYLTLGPAGGDLSRDGGISWVPTGARPGTSGADPTKDPAGWHALAVSPSGRFAWAVGEGGRIGRLDLAEALKAP